MWENSANWSYDNIWKNQIKWENKSWNNFSNSHLNNFSNSNLNNFQKITINDQTNIKQKTEIKMKGFVNFSYIVNTNYSFRQNWDNRVSELTKVLSIRANDGNCSVKIDLDSGEYDRIKNLVKGQMTFELCYFTLDNDRGIRNKRIIEFLHDYSEKPRNILSINFDEIYIFDKEKVKIYDRSKESYTKKKVEDKKHEVQKTKIETIEVDANKESIIIKQNTIEITEKVDENKPAFTKILDETKKRFRKKTFEIVKAIEEIDGIPVKAYIVRQIRGDKNRKRYTLNQNDCEVIGIEYKENLEVLPMDLKFENVYKKVKNS